MISQRSPWRNRLARSAVNRKAVGSSPPGDVYFFFEFSLVHYRISLEDVVQLTFNRSSFFAFVTTLDKVQGLFDMKVVSAHMTIFLVNIKCIFV